MIDNQWPKHLQIDNLQESNLFVDLSLISEIESFFKEKYEHDVLLFPSARSGLASILTVEGISRSNVIYSPIFSSHCVWDIITRVANPSIRDDDSDVAVVSHKWGSITKLESMNSKLVIEDSVDSLLIDKSSLFHNNGKFEIISLPKILGTLSGGIVICANQHDFINLKEERDNNYNIEFSKIQSLNKASGKNDWMMFEYKNRLMLNFELEIVLEKLNKWDLFIEIIENRLLKLTDYISYSLNSKRLPPLIFIQKKIEGLMIRNFDIAQKTGNCNYVEGSLFPIHVGINESEFTSNLNKLKRVY